MKHTIEKCVCVRETDKAILVECDEFDEALWIPLSQIDDDSEVYKEGTEGDLIASSWFAEKKGWI